MVGRVGQGRVGWGRMIGRDNTNDRRWSDRRFSRSCVFTCCDGGLMLFDVWQCDMPLAFRGWRGWG